MKTTLQFEYGNGYLGSRSNIGSKLILANTISEAKKIFNTLSNVKIGRMGNAKELDVLQ